MRLAIRVTAVTNGLVRTVARGQFYGAGLPPSGAAIVDAPARRRLTPQRPSFLLSAHAWSPDWNR